MELLFENNKLISKSEDVNSKISENIASIYLKYTRDSNLDIYSSCSTQPISHIYCATKLNNIFEEEKILFGESKTICIKEKENIQSKFYLIDSDDEKYKEEFHVFNLENKETKELNYQQMEAILCSIFTCSVSIADRVYIISDELGDSYNDRAIDILKQIYIKLPYFMRKKIGYNTYSVGDDDASGIKLLITTRNNRDIEGEFVIDLKSNDYYDVISKVDKNVKELVDDILQLDENRILNLYDEIYDIYSLNNLTINKFSDVFYYLNFYTDREINDETIENYIGDIDEAYNENNEIDQELFERMVSDIKDNLSNAIINEYIKSNFNNTQDLNNIDKRAIFAFSFIYYSNDFLEGVFNVDIDLVENWFKEKRVPYLENNYTVAECIRILAEDKKIVENLETKIKITYKPYDTKNIEAIKERANIFIDRKLRQLNQSVQRYIKDEQRNIKSLIRNINSLDELLKIVEDIKINYSSNNEFFRNKVESKVLDIMLSYKNYLSLNNININNLTEENYEILSNNMKLNYEKDINLIKELYKRNLICDDNRISVLDVINTNFKLDESCLEYRYYSDLILNANGLKNIGNYFEAFLKESRYLDMNKYKLVQILNSAFEKNIDLDKKRDITISVNDLKYFLSKYHNFLQSKTMKIANEYLKEKVGNQNDLIEEFKPNLDENTVDIILATIYRVVNKDINKLFRKSILIKQDLDFEKGLENAKGNYAALQMNEQAFLIFDNTVNRTGEDGFVLTEKYMYYKNFDGKNGKILISDIDDVSNLKNKNMIYIDDIGIRCDIIKENHRNRFRNLILSILYLLQNIDSEFNIKSIIREVISFQ